jgi:CRISPR-associated protein Cas2
MSRGLYLIAYDITDDGRLNRMRHLLKGYSTGGQKSVFECFLSPSEVREVVRQIRTLINPDEDRVHVFIMDARSRTHTLGIGLQPKDPSFFYFG